MTAKALQTSLSATATTTNIKDAQPKSSVPQSWACNTCHVSFDSGPAQRVHMKGPWHVYNLKRRIASLPSIPWDTFKDQIQTQPEPTVVKEHVREERVDEPEEHPASPHTCLFCNHDFGALEDTVEHMSAAHGLFIPDQHLISDLETFLGYLGTEVRVWHDCLFCGTTRTSTHAIQTHMRDSGHCMLNLEREPELREFWEPGTTNPEDGHVHIRVGRPGRSELAVAPMRPHPHQRRPRPAPRARDDNRLIALRTAAAEVDSPSPPHPDPAPLPKKRETGRQLSRRDEMGLRNLLPQQRHALAVAERRSQKAEEVATRAREWSYARKANSQKHDQEHGALAWAKAGMHNLLPR